MRVVRVALVMVALLAVAGCDSSTAADDSPDVESLRDSAAQVTDLWVANDWKAIRAEFDDNMRRRLAEDGLANAWKQVTALRGDYVSRDEPTQVPIPGAFTVFDTPMHFKNGDMKSRVSFDGHGRIAGLFILKPEVQ